MALISAVGVILWLGVGVYYKADDHNAKKKLDMISYVCGSRQDRAIDQEIGALCVPMRYVWWAVLIVGVLELATMGTVTWGVIALRRKGTYSKI